MAKRAVKCGTQAWVIVADDPPVTMIGMPLCEEVKMSKLMSHLNCLVYSGGHDSGIQILRTIADSEGFRFLPQVSKRGYPKCGIFYRTVGTWFNHLLKFFIHLIIIVTGQLCGD